MVWPIIQAFEEVLEFGSSLEYTAAPDQPGKEPVSTKHTQNTNKQAITDLRILKDVTIKF